MPRVCFHSDDSFRKSGCEFVTAGLALDGIKSEIKTILTKIESRSGKGQRDWHSTKDPLIRARYVEGVLSSSPFVGRVFYRAAPRLQSSEYWDFRVEALTLAVLKYTHRGRCHHEIAQEGFTAGSRLKLQRELKGRGLKRVTVEPCDVGVDEEIRCADALAGFIRTKLFDGAGSSELLPALPDWLLNLSP